MLTHYFELRAVPQIEISQVEVINQLMQCLHLNLVNHQGNIAVSFPCYGRPQKKTVGGIIRLHGPKLPLMALYEALANVALIRDYAITLPILPIPDKVTGYSRLIRVNPKGQSALRRAEKRLTAQGKWSLDVKQKMVEKWGNVHLDYPHLCLKSHSTGQQFILWLKQQSCNEPIQGEFNSYGLSRSATVPVF